METCRRDSFSDQPWLFRSMRSGAAIYDPTHTPAAAAQGDLWRVGPDRDDRGGWVAVSGYEVDRVIEPRVVDDEAVHVVARQDHEVLVAHQPDFGDYRAAGVDLRHDQVDVRTQPAGEYHLSVAVAVNRRPEDLVAERVAAIVGEPEVHQPGVGGASVIVQHHRY